MALHSLPLQISRQQAQLGLKEDGSFQIRNVGRHLMQVNGVPLGTGASLPVPHLSLVDISGIPLLLMINAAAVARVLRRSQQVLQ